MSKKLLQDKVAIVTGAGRGLGEAVARAYAAEGAKVVVSDIDASAAQKVADSLPGAIAVACDVRKSEQVKALVDAAVSKHGRLDIMVPNAGVARVAPLVSTSYEEWREVTSVNLDGVFLCIRHAAPAIIAAGGGSIINMASVTAKAACALIGSYAAAKAGVVSLTQTAAVELRAHKVRVNAILPGFIDTELVKSHIPEFEEQLKLPDFGAVVAQRQGRYGTVEEVAHLAVFLASERSSFSTGSGFVLDGGVSSSLL
ncbi:SDR family NAD(P)-dependent oxidoreductase [Variovorax sp. OV329]|uniref:SDR family NAD(P)-dependent oxidoreductase n=1 Tax=Variovorax sp. OV329 TaxID=1882825 RepID=UPI0008DF8039|nr:glucose 1-dehydrogenase [Variovorax sp. OV329]SFM55399.1 NAD(P)-dependent dehydrogenase, short-chain alcohol dehydrogenase family [Variovorax sp. OV329]